MATPNWFNRRKGKTQVEEDVYKLDPRKTPEESTTEILTGLYLRNGGAGDSPTGRTVLGTVRPRQPSDARRISYLNSLVTILTKEDTKNGINYTTEELMLCLRISLVDESPHVRSTALRVLRYLLCTARDVQIFNNLRLPYLVARSMDIMLRNEVERAQALRVVRRVVGAAAGAAGAAGVAPALLRCLAAVARVGSSTCDSVGDRLCRPAVATLGEIGVLNPALFISCGGVCAVTHFLQELGTPRMAEAVCGVLLHMLDAPALRRAARVDLRCLCAPYCDFNLKSGLQDKNREEREKRFTCCRLSLLCVLRSWPGVLHFCHPLSDSGLRALVHAGLHLQRLEVRNAILDLLYELLGLPQPEWTDEISVALAAVDPTNYQNSWRLKEGFVAEEGSAILPHLGATGPDITEIHLALLLYCFLEAGLLDGLAEVIVTGDTFISVRATILLGQLLHLMHLLLPPEVCSITPPLPALLAHAAAGKPQALAAVAALQRLHTMLEARPAANSLFLDNIIQYCSGIFAEEETKLKPAYSQTSPVKEDSLDLLNDFDYAMEQTQRHSLGSRSECTSGANQSALVKSKSVSSRTSSVVSKVTKSKLFNMFDRESDSLLRDSLVMQNKDGNTWNWDIIRTILKESGEDSGLQLGDGAHAAWTRRVLTYLRPSSNKYSHTDSMSGHEATRAGCQLVRLLLRSAAPEAHRLLEELFQDVNSQVEAILNARTAHDCLFSPQHMCNTMCQMYFLFAGQLCHTQPGLQIIYDTGLYKSLLELSTTTHHSCYVKLVISSLDYTLDSYPRDILAKTLTCSNESSRMYTTQFLNVLLRASQKSTELMRSKMKGVTMPRKREHRYTNNGEAAEGTSRSAPSPPVDMDTWILRMLVQQLKDESKAVVWCALAALDEACNVPSLFRRLVTMRESVRENCGLSRTEPPGVARLGRVGDRGYLLWLQLEVADTAANDPQHDAFITAHLQFWNTTYNSRYMRLIDAETHEALTLACDEGATETRRFRSGSTRRGPALPPHLYAALARLPHGRRRLASVLPAHYQCIKRGRCDTEQDRTELKASLWALGNAATSAQGVELLLALSGGLEDSVFVSTVRLGMHCEVYSVRATAFYTLGLMGCTHAGANQLYELGWLCVRHTRHDRFPIIHEENWSLQSESTDELRRRIATSPPQDTAEHSDHTDHSTAESLHSDHTKTSSIRLMTSVTLERSLTEESCDSDTVDFKISTPLKVDRSASECSDADKKKSHTLPPRSCPILERDRLHESVTVEILKDATTFANERREGPVIGVARDNSLEHYEGRKRNPSESSTSGVSSCDSVLGRYVLPDRFQTLSPIPSSSSLIAMKGISSRRRTEVQRRTSATSYTGGEVASSPPSQKDVAGYAELKQFNSSRRPHLSESSAVSGADAEDVAYVLSALDTVGERRPRAFSSLRARRAAPDKHNKRSILNYDWKPITASESASRLPLPPTPTELRAGGGVVIGSAPRVTSLRPAPPRTDGPCYIGICLPANLIHLFPRLEGPNYSEAPPGGSAEFPSPPPQPAAADTTADEVDHTFTSFNKGLSGWAGAAWRHDAGACLACAARSAPARGVRELREAFLAGMESPRAGPSSLVERSPCAAGGGAGGAATATSLTCTSLDLTGSSPAPSLDCTLSENNDTVNNEIMKHATRMGNPLWHRQSKPALLALKQRHPEAFQSVCLYSEVSALVANGSYMMAARRFLQELFLDTTFECFFQEPHTIVHNHSGRGAIDNA